ncbi:unnamed protein product [Rhizophagus irregularis]|uniref:F-box domain-containing protein n=1 Tax=Rhizophagus irregularis TaxID=588596 RepID=A0A2I1FSP8_9GLOM|nr:hypothetical protein RhiirA4_450222 [Rhizophagus irregularis]CAB4424417.1 unnamed protein product [Rhizophagus irregularis]
MTLFSIYNLFNRIQNCLQENFLISSSSSNNNNNYYYDDDDDDDKVETVLSTSFKLNILPTECVQKIVQYLLEEKQGLYSCLLINRYWCKIVISYLYRQPFELCSSKNRLKLFRTYLLCFDQVELDSLSIRMIDALYIFNIFPKNRNPLFNYFIFLRKVASIEIEEFISPIYNELGINNKSKFNLEFRDEIPKFNKLIFHHIFKYSINLKLFDLDHWMKNDIITIDDNDDDGDDDGDDDEVHKVHEVHQVHVYDYPGLFGINKFKIKNIGAIVEGKSKIFQFISTYCKNITCLEISLFSLDYSKKNILKMIINLIKSQKRLYEFRISHVNRNNDIDPIMESLYSYQRNYLIKLSFTFVKFTEDSLNTLVKLERLKDLTLIFCKNITNNILNQDLRLERLQISCVPSFYNMLLDILNVCGGTLKVLDLNIHFKPFQKKIIALCPNIIELNIDSTF